MNISIHRIRFQWAPSVAIEIESSKGKGVAASHIVPEIPACIEVETEVSPDDYELKGIPAIGWRGEADALFERFQLRENTDYLLDITLPISMEEAVGLSQQSKTWPLNDRYATIFRRDPMRRWHASVEGGVTVTGQIRLGNHAGIIELSSAYGHSLRVEVVCKKLGYFEEFKILLTDVARAMCDLLLQLDSPLSLPMRIADEVAVSDVGLMFLIRYIMSGDNLPLAIDEISDHMHSLLFERQAIELLEHVDEARADLFLDELDSSIVRKGGPLSRLFRGFTPTHLVTVETVSLRDTPENRYVKYFLEELSVLLSRLIHALSADRKHNAAREATTWLEQIEEMLSRAMWREVGKFTHMPSNSQVLQRRRGYRELFEFDRVLRMGLQLPWKRADDIGSGLLGDIRPINELYEYWCFFAIREALSEICEFVKASQSDIIKLATSGLEVKLSKGKRSRLGFTMRHNDCDLAINLFYNHNFRRPNKALDAWLGSYTTLFKPDISVEISQKGSTKRHWLHFDAKYRIDFDPLEAVAENESEDNEVEEVSFDQEIALFYQQEDLFKMHTYRDGILGSRGAYVLFPGNAEDADSTLFVRHPSAFGMTSAPAYLFPSIGAYPLTPGRKVTQQENLKRFLKAVFESIADNDEYTEEDGYFSSD
ncbi:MAG: DUF2357 domain-containing protein [Candidatus Melainabacteria bacterium]|nr:DUF2357 domain-containing protein [Candidatus Melainabacteria bacterium]